MWRLTKQSRHDSCRRAMQRAHLVAGVACLVGITASSLTATATMSRMSTWKRHAGLDCSKGHGATEVATAGRTGRQSGPDSAVITMSLAQCQQRCSLTPGCTALTTDVLNVSWVKHDAYNCYKGHGADELIDGSGTVSQCNEMTVPECRTQCVLTPGCSAVVYDTQQDYCCLRANVSLHRCDHGDPEWNTHVIEATISIPESQRPCRLHSAVTIGECDAQSETSDTYVLNEAPLQPWWLTTHFAERSLMLRRYSCSPPTLNRRGVCNFREAQQLLPRLEQEGYSVVNVDWPVSASPDSLYEGFGASDYYRVDPLLGTTADWHAFTSTAHLLGLKVVADFNPSYFWTGANKFKKALADVRLYGIGDALPAASPAHWFRWRTKCPGAIQQPPDANPQNGFTDGWVYSPVAQACYWSVWGIGQPAGDLSKPEWRAELTKIFTFWVKTMGVDGFMLDDPSAYLAADDQTDNEKNDLLVSRYIREVIVDPMHQLGAAVWGEMYNFQRPTTAKMLDAGRNTDMPDGTPGFPGKLHDMVVSGDVTGLETLLVETVDRWVGWCGTPRTQPDVRGNVAVAGQKAAITALLGGYYVMRAGATYPCHPHYDSKTPGDAWPGGCFGDWNGTAAVAQTLKSIRTSPALSPGAPRQALQLDASSGPGGYAALRTRGSHAAVVVLNVASRPANISIELTGTAVARPQTPVDLLTQRSGPKIVPGTLWQVQLPANGWGVLSVKLKQG